MAELIAFYKSCNYIEYIDAEKTHKNRSMEFGFSQLHFVSNSKCELYLDHENKWVQDRKKENKRKKYEENGAHSTQNIDYKRATSISNNNNKWNGL